MNPPTGFGQKIVILSLTILAMVIILGATVKESGTTRQKGKSLSPPSFETPMGTDRLGRNLTWRIAAGTSGTFTLVAGTLLIAVPLACAFGFPVGFLAGRFRVTTGNFLILAGLAFGIYIFFLAPVETIAVMAGRLLGPSWPPEHLSILFKTVLISIASMVSGLFLCIVADIDDSPTGPGNTGSDILTPCIEALHNAWTTVPCYILAMVLLGFMGHSPVTTILALGLTAWPYPAGVLAAAAISCRGADFIIAAKACGASRFDILVRHIAGCIGWAASHGIAAMAAYAAAGEATLGFLNIGAGADMVTLGSIAAGFKDYPEAWWLALFPCGVTAWLVTTLSGIVRKSQRLNSFP